MNTARASPRRASTIRRAGQTLSGAVVNRQAKDCCDRSARRCGQKISAAVKFKIRRERAQLERYWLAEMERLGAELVHARHADRRPVTDQPPYPETHFVEAWLKKKAHAAKVRAAWLYAIPLAVSIIAAVAACIAAWPVLKEWLAR